MKHKTLFCVLALSALSLCAWEVKIGKDASEADKNAAADLKHYLKRTAKSLKINGKEAVFIVADKTLAKNAGIKTEALQEEEWNIRSKGNQIILIGGGQRGTSYAIYHFIEDFLNVRWWNPSEEDVPSAKDLKFSNISKSGKPFFSYRDIYYTGHPYGNGKFHVRSRLNGWAGIKRRLGGSIHFGPPHSTHTLAHYLHPSKYMKDHPEYFALLKDGKRNGTVWKGQLCFSSEGAYQEVEKQLMKYLDQRHTNARKSGNSPARIFSISQHDNHNYCLCPKCKEAFKTKNPTDMLLNWVNRMARKAAEKHPDVFIETLAYHYTETLPKVEKIEDNVIVRFCDTTGNPFFSFYHPLNKYMHDLLPKWRKICKNIMIWDYAITYDETAGLPVSSEYTYPEIHKFYADNSVMGIFWEHENPNGSDFFPLKFYLELKYLENPYRTDFEELRKDFMTRYYGPAADALTEYRELLRDEVKRNPPNIRGYSKTVAHFKFISIETALKMLAAVQKAEKAAAHDPALRRKVDIAGNGIYKLLGEALKDHYIKEWEKKYPGRKYPLDIHAIRQKLGNTWLENENALRKPNPPPAFMKGIKTVEFNSGFSRAGQHVRAITEKDAINKSAYCIHVDEVPANIKLPEVFGFWERYPKIATKRFITEEELAKFGPGYHWFKCGNIDAKDLRDIRVYISRQWTLQKNLPQALPHVWSGKKMDLWIHIKFEGPKFYKGSKDANRICVDRVIFTEAGKIPENAIK